MSDSIENSVAFKKAYKEAAAERTAAEEKGEHKYFFTTYNMLVRWVEHQSWAQQVYRYDTRQWDKADWDIRDDGWPIEQDVAEAILQAKNEDEAKEIHDSTTKT